MRLAIGITLGFVLGVAGFAVLTLALLSWQESGAKTWEVAAAFYLVAPLTLLGGPFLGGWFAAPKT